MSKSNYIDEKQLIEQWEVWKNSGSKPEYRKIPDPLIQQMYLVASHLLEHPRFSRYNPFDKEDMKQEAVLKMTKNLKNFKPEKGKLFSYLTTCCWTAFVIHLANYYKELNKKRELLTQALTEAQCRQDIRQSQAMQELLRQLDECQKQNQQKGDG